MKHDFLIKQLLTQNTVILAREHPEAVRCALKRAATAGKLFRVLPGVYADPGSGGDLATRVAAVSRWDPSAVICGRAAAALTYWPHVDVGPVEVASPVRHAKQTGFVFTERRIPPDLMQTRAGGIRVIDPSLTAVELATLEWTDPIDVALRERAVSLDSLRAALRLASHRRGNQERWRVLLDSRAEPWSAAERLAHRLYRKAGIGGWVGNHKVVALESATYYLDIAFRRERVASEIDGQFHDRDRVVFEGDRLRQNTLLLSGWLILRFTWQMLTEDPEYVIATTRAALAMADPNKRRAARWPGGTSLRRR